MRGRALLCDEVGLGKTVEAGWCSRSTRSGGWRAGSWVLTPSLPG